MRPLLASLALLVVACTETAPRPPPTTRFIYPSGIVHRPVESQPHGVLYVASANFDRCYDQGTVIAVDLDKLRLDPNDPASVSLPAIGAAAASSEPLRFETLDLGIGEQSHVAIQSFASDMALWTPSAASSPRLFIPTRSDGDFLQVIEAPTPTQLACLGQGLDKRDCSADGVPLSEKNGTGTELLRAPSPIGVAVSSEGKVWVTHLTPASSPDDDQEFNAYVVRMDADAGNTDAMRSSASFNRVSPLGTLPEGGTHAAAIGEKYVFVTGRYASGISNANSTRRFLIRALDKETPSRVVDLGVDLAFAALDARGLALDSAQKRLYVAVRSPDALLVVDVLDATTAQPRLAVVGVVPMPDGPSQVKMIRRNDLEGLTGRSDLVAVSSSEGGVVSIFDPDVGQVVAQIPVGEDASETNAQPYGLAIQRAETGRAARIFVSNFGEGRISVIDIPDLARPQGARLVAWLGVRHDSTQAVGAGTCQEVSQ
jgi:DNA-binding beta-propeller fold protein YncE